MNPRHERPGIPYGTTFSTFVLHEESFDFSWHYHQAYELALITQGRGTRYVGTTVEPLRTGDLLVLGPDLPHTFTSAQDPEHPAEAACAQFPADFLGPDFFALPQFDQIAALLDASVHGIVHSPAPPPVRDILTTLMDQPAALQTARLLEALHLLAVAPGGVPITGPGYISAPDPAVRERVDKVCRHLEQVHTRHVELTEVAGLVHMAPTSFSRFFRRAMGRTLTEYLNQLRVETACRLLTNTNAPIIEVAASSGYVNLSNFNRRFRELKGMSPRDYRQATLRP